ncbi:RTA1 like protein, partial [Jaminaea rosea]
EHGPYGYEPILWLPILFSGLYALSALLHVAQVSSTRHWWLLVLVFGCIAESAGNGIRIYGHFDARAIDPYIAQQVILVVTPVFFAAVHFATLGRIIELFGQAFTFRYLSPAAITPCFVLLDLASLAVQGTGSGMAATAEVNGKDTTWGGRIVVIGLCVQLVGYACFNWLLLTFVWRAVVTHHSTVSSNRLWTGKFKFFLLTFFLSSLLVLGRSTFRTYEMIKGWVGPISTVEWYFYAFDAAPVCAASLLLNLMFPGWVLP